MPTDIPLTDTPITDDAPGPTAHSGEREGHELIGSDRVEGTPVRRPDGSTLGEIRRVMIDKRSGRVAYAVMSFGGFLGFGEGQHPVPWGALRYDPELGGYVLDVTDEQLRAAPTGDGPFDWGDRDANGRLADHYNVPPYWVM